MLLYTRRAAPKPPKRRSRAGCVHCKEKKKKCTEEHPACQRCVDRGLECLYEPIQPRKRRRTQSPAEPSRPAVEPSASTASSPTVGLGPGSRIESLRHDPEVGTAPLTLSLSSPSLSVAASWEMPPYDDTASQYTSDFRSEASISPEAMDPFPRGSMRHSSVPVESMDMFLGEYDRRRSHLSTPEGLSEHWRRPSHAGTPDIMTVPYRRTSDSGMAEVFASIPVASSQNIDAPDAVTFAPTTQNHLFHQNSPSMISSSNAQSFAPIDAVTVVSMGSIPTMHHQQVDTANFPVSGSASNAFYHPAGSYSHAPVDANMTISNAFYQDSSSCMPPPPPPPPLQRSTEQMEYWPSVDRGNPEFYVPDHQ